MPLRLFHDMMLLVMVGEAVPQYIPLPLFHVAPVILNPDINALLVAIPSNFTAYPSNGGSIVGAPCPIKAIPLLI